MGVGGGAEKNNLGLLLGKARHCVFGPEEHLIAVWSVKRGTFWGKSCVCSLAMQASSFH